MENNPCRFYNDLPVWFPPCTKPMVTSLKSNNHTQLLSLLQKWKISTIVFNSRKLLNYTQENSYVNQCVLFIKSDKYANGCWFLMLVKSCPPEEFLYVRSLVPPPRALHPCSQRHDSQHSGVVVSRSSATRNSEDISLLTRLRRSTKQLKTRWKTNKEKKPSVI